MPQLETMTPENEPQSLIIYGPSFSGKSTLAAQAAKKFNVLYIDGENGSSVLQKLPVELKKNIFVQKISDNKDHPNFIRSALLLASGSKVHLCDAHGIAMNNRPTITPCADCQKLAKEAEAKGLNPVAEGIINEWHLNTMGPSKWVVIFDSLTQLASSTNAHVTKGMNIEKDKEEFKHWMAQGKLLEKFLDYIQDARYNRIVISHEECIDQEDGSKKIVPAAGTQNFSRKVARYFQGAIYCQLKNKKHVVLSKTVDDVRIIAGTRSDVVITDADSLCEFFGK